MSQRKAPPKIGAPAAELLPAVIESLLFVAEEPQEINTLAKATNTTRKQVERALEELSEAAMGRGLFVQRLGDRVQLATVPDAAPYVERFLEVEHGRLSRASLETLAIIAYRQPVTRGEIEAVRGVDPDHAVQMLLARELIEEVGRAPGPGRPVLFATTVRFLEYFGLRRPDDLPPLPELEAAAEAAGGGDQRAMDEVVEEESPQPAERPAEAQGVDGGSAAEPPHSEAAPPAEDSIAEPRPQAVASESDGRPHAQTGDAEEPDAAGGDPASLEPDPVTSPAPR